MEKCQICFDILSKKVFINLKCHPYHKLCANCLLQIMETQGHIVCPFCRTLNFVGIVVIKSLHKKDLETESEGTISIPDFESESETESETEQR